MKKSQKKLIALVRRKTTIFALFAVLFFIWLFWTFGISSNLRETKSFTVRPGASVGGVAIELNNRGIIDSVDGFKVLVLGFGGNVQAGQYDLPAGAGTWRIAKILARGEIASTTILIPEGLTVRQIVNVLNANLFLTGVACDGGSWGGLSAERTGGGYGTKSSELSPPPSPSATLPPNPGSQRNEVSWGGNRGETRLPCPTEGTLFPDTYIVPKGTSRAAVLKLMSDKMDSLRIGWENSGRSAPAPLRSWNEIITLASIIQKETPLPVEMPVVASVYLNRLRANMRLQADPTVVYALTDRLGDMQGGALLLEHLQIDSPYNTYKNYGLPPRPIANPGKAAISAVLNPADTDYLFFVADGNGGHNFAKDYDEHKTNQAKWREIKGMKDEVRGMR